MRRAIAFLIVVALCGLSHMAFARDVALVIGNDDYLHVPRLSKARNDAHAVAAALRASGFAVTQTENVDQRTMSRALVDFENSLGQGDRALFYFSGHGFALNDSNYLLPIDVPSVESNQGSMIRDAAFPVDHIVDDIRQHGAGVAILVLDACRNNPFATASTRSLPMTRGLARIEAPEGVFVLTSAGPKQAALDSLSATDPDPNSVFTRIFLKELRPGRTLVDIAKRTQVSVRSLAATIGFEQLPAYSDQVIGDIVLAADPKVDPLSLPADQTRTGAASVQTQIATTANTQGGAGVSMGTRHTGRTGCDHRRQGRPCCAQGAGRCGRRTGGHADAASQSGWHRLWNSPDCELHAIECGWSVMFSLPEPAVSLEYRLGDRGDFRETGLMDILDPRTGQRMPNSSIQLPGKTAATVIEVKYERQDGSAAGPFPIRFDPEIALFDSQRQILKQLWPSWVEFRSFNGLLVYFTTLITYRCAITEVRYGLDGAAPLTRFDLPPCNQADPFSIPTAAKLMLKVPPSTTSIGLQVTWKDGTRSDFNTIEK